MTKKDFEPIRLKGEEALWFVDYLEGKTATDKQLEKNRTNILKKASKVENHEMVCL
ncbi:hypothetical protein M0P48_04785 [Candidatus Gracilibacteria bacterium]|jgi:hypothetical protein|nr:hypothetical protein [Candidatus Gracilibacteria bacterium]